MTEAELLERLADLLVSMRFAAEAGAQTAHDASPHITSGSAMGNAPPFNGEPLIEKYVGGSGELTLLVYKMERDLRRVTHRAPKKEIREERDKRIVSAYAGWPAEKVGVFEDLGVQTVRDIRKRGGVRPADGQGSVRTVR